MGNVPGSSRALWRKRAGSSVARRVDLRTVARNFGRDLCGGDLRSVECSVAKRRPTGVFNKHKPTKAALKTFSGGQSPEKIVVKFLIIHGSLGECFHRFIWGRLTLRALRHES
jgi:hypothetical protein